MTIRVNDHGEPGVRFTRNLSALVIIAALGCAGLYGYPSKEKTDDAFAKLAKLPPGTNESDINYLFPPLPYGATGEYGILEVNSYVTENSSSRTYWIGYYYLLSGGYVTTKRVVSYTAVNGKIVSAFFPQ